jgi:hypothetical protein
MPLTTPPATDTPEAAPVAPPSPSIASKPPADRWIAFALFAVTLAVYGATLCRTIYTGDDGDFITAMATTGITHPTGYPLFCLLGKLFLLLPIGEPATRINLMTAVCGAGAVAMFYRFLAVLVPERLWAIFGALLLAFSPTLWQQSLSCEVYTLTCVFLATLLYLTALLRREPDNARLLRIMAFVYGLSLTHHLLMALFLPAFLVLVLTTRRTLLREGALLGSLVGLFVLPLVLYAYLPLAALYGHSPVKWGNPNTFPDFWAHVTGAQYRGAMFSQPGRVGPRLAQYSGLLVAQFGWWWLWLAPVGLVTLLRDKALRPLALLTLYIFVVNVTYSVNYAIFDVYVYYLPSYLMTAAWITMGVSAGLRWFWDRRGTTVADRAHVLRLVSPVAIAVLLVQMSLHYAETDKSGNYLAADYAANILHSAPRNSIAVVGGTVEGGSVTFTIWYRQFVLGERPDVVVIDPNIFPAVFWGNNWYYYHLTQRYPELARAIPEQLDPTQAFDPNTVLVTVLQQAVASGKPVFYLPPDRNTTNRSVNAPLVQQVAGAFSPVPWGLGQLLLPKGATPPVAELADRNQAVWAKFETRGLYDGWAHSDEMQQFIPMRYAEAGVAFGQIAEKAGRFAEADAAYAKASLLYQIPEADAGRERLKGRLAATAK